MARAVGFAVLALSGIALVAARRAAAPVSTTSAGEIVVSAIAAVALVVVLGASARAPRTGSPRRR